MISKCGKCSSLSFELVEQAPRGSKYKLLFVQCASCGAPVGVLEYFNSGVQIENTNKKIQSLENKIDNIEYILRQAIARLR
jgi:transcription initiation factor IIE alpha subunit